MVKGRSVAKKRKQSVQSNSSSVKSHKKARHIVHRVRDKLSQVKKRHIRTSIAIIGVIFFSAITMMVVYRGYNFEINWFSIIIVSLFLAFILGAVEYMYIVRVKGY